MSKKLPKDNLKKVSGGVAGKNLGGSKGAVTGDAVLGKRVPGEKEALPGQVNWGKSAGNKGVSGKNEIADFE